jgi:hypothetical protein
MNIIALLIYSLMVITCPSTAGAGDDMFRDAPPPLISVPTPFCSVEEGTIFYCCTGWLAAGHAPKQTGTLLCFVVWPPNPKQQFLFAKTTPDPHTPHSKHKSHPHTVKNYTRPQPLISSLSHPVSSPSLAPRPGFPMIDSGSPAVSYHALL